MDFALKEWDVTLSLTNLTSTMVNTTQEFIQNDIGRLRILNLHRNKVIVFDPENGHIELELYLPSPVTSIKRLPKIQIKKYLTRLENMIKKVHYLVTDFNIYDIYYRYRIYTQPQMWIPPFEGMSMLMVFSI